MYTERALFSSGKSPPALIQTHSPGGLRRTGAARGLSSAWHKGLLPGHSNHTLGLEGSVWEAAETVLTCRHPRILDAAVQLPNLTLLLQIPCPSVSPPADQHDVLSVTSHQLPRAALVQPCHGGAGRQPAGLTLPAAGITLPTASSLWEWGLASVPNEAHTWCEMLS